MTVTSYRPRITVFVSSTIRECASDRKEAARAVEALSQSAFAFEDEGSSPHPPRAVYLSALRDADVFIGIYRKQYGWVAPDMTISGLEDEFAFAAELGIPRFIYIHSDDTGRDARLAKMLADLSQVTYSKYSAPSELFERIRADIGSELARRWKLAEERRLAPLHSATKLLDAIAPPGTRLVRKSVLDAIERELAEKRIVEVTGPLGSGKSVLLASLAAKQQWPFVVDPESALALIETVDRAIAPNALPAGHVTAQERVATWSREHGGTIVIDGCRDVGIVAATVDAISQRRGQPRIVFSSTVPRSTGFQRLEVPRLTREEVQEYLAKRGGTSPTPESVRLALQRSGGLPLFLRLIAAGGGEGSLEDIERARFTRLPTEARELAQLLAIAGGPLDVRVVQDLLDMRSFEKLIETLRVAQDLVVYDGTEVDLGHAHIRLTLRSIAAVDGPRTKVQARQIAKALYASGDTVRSVLLALANNVTVAPARLRRAANDAAIVNDFSALARIEFARRRVLVGRADAVREFVFASMSMANALSEIGRDGEATPIWAEASDAARSANDSELVGLLEEMTLVRSAIATASTKDVKTVIERQEKAVRSGDKWRAAKLSIDLSTVFLRVREFENAIRYSSQARDLFKELGEPYGQRIALKNLAGALLSTSGREDEGKALVEALGREDRLTKREEAWWLNMRCRLLRREGKHAEAAELSERAVAIGEELGDLGVVSINANNRGNAAIALGDSKGAEYWFTKASDAAKTSGSISGEALASIRLAELLETEAPAKAEAYASHAVALLRGSVAVDDLARACHVHGRILEEMGRTLEAAESFGTALFSGGLDEPTGLSALGSMFDALLKRHSMVEAIDVLVRWSGEPPEDRELVLAANTLAIKLINTAPGPAGAQLAALVFRRVVREMPAAIRRRFFRQSVRVLMGAAPSSSDLWALVGLLRCNFSDAVTLEDLRWLGDQIHDRAVGVSFRVHDDGAVIATVAIGRDAGPLWVTITQIDDKVETAIVSMVLWLLLHGSGPAFAKEVLADLPLRRTEVEVKTVAFSEVKELGLPIREEELNTGGTVTRPTAIGDDVPTIVVYRDGAMERAERGFLALLGWTLNEIAIQFLGRETQEDSMVRVLSHALSPLFMVDRDGG